MQKSIFIFLLIISFFKKSEAQQEALVKQVNVFLGTSGDHGQLSPGASYPFSMLDIAPQTYPNIHTGYEYKAKEILGFTHNRLEGVGCMGSGGNLLIKPFLGSSEKDGKLIKAAECASPGYYHIAFTNGIIASFIVNGKMGIEQYHLPGTNHGFFIDFSHELANGFRREEHHLSGNIVYGWIESGTTCSVGTYRVYYALQFDQPVEWKDSTQHTITAVIDGQHTDVIVRIALSSVSEAYAKADIHQDAFETAKRESEEDWNNELGQIKVSGNPERKKLFYSLLYRTLQSPYYISEPDGSYKATNDSVYKGRQTAYNGWSIWDNYKTDLPLLSIMQPQKYQDMVTSIVNLYKYGKENWATQHEPSNTVRTEHSIVVLLDAYRKGYRVDFKSIRDSLLKETNSLDFFKPDKSLESSYDTWAMAEILGILHEDSLSKVYRNKAADWKQYWRKDFKDLTKKDIDKFSARNMYQGTIWQYRWFVPFDVRGLMEECGGEQSYLDQLDQFFNQDYYSATNEPDIQVPYMYQFTKKPWKSQSAIRHYAKDTVVQYYYDDNYRGIDPTIDRAYNNRPDAFVRSMDDDAGAMSAWYILAACGISPVCVGWPVYYLHVPLFEKIIFINNGKRPFMIKVANWNEDRNYIMSATLNGKPLDRNWLTYKEIMNGGELIITSCEKPNKDFGIKNQWMTDINR